MRISRLAILPALALVSLSANRGEAQVSATIQIGQPQRSWGREVPVYNYAPETYGPWQTSYRRWTPVTVYYVNGHYYPNRVRGSRSVVLYRSGNQTFLPPRDQAWDGRDRRYNYRSRPNDDDYGHAQPAPPPGRGRGRP